MKALSLQEGMAKIQAFFQAMIQEVTNERN